MIKKTFTHLILSAVLLVIALGGYGVWFTLASKQSAHAALLAREIKNKQQDSARVSLIKSSLSVLEKDEESVQSYFVSTTDVVTYLGSLEELGKSLGAEVEVLSVSADKEKPSGHLNLSLRITGSFAAVTKTLGAIEYQPYDTVLKNVTLDSPGGIASSTPVWTAAAVIVVGTTPTPKPNILPPVPTATTTPTL